MHQYVKYVIALIYQAIYKLFLNPQIEKKKSEYLPTYDFFSTRIIH